MQTNVTSVLHVMDSLERSGMEMMLLNSGPEWGRLGCQCDIVATRNTAGPLADELRASGYGVFHLPFRSRYRYLPSPTFFRDFFRLCRSGYDVVHIHSEATPVLAASIAKAAGVRQIAVTPHNAFKFSGFLRLRKRFERRLVRLLGGRYGMISESVRQCEWDRFHNEGVRIWNWIDTSRFRPPTARERAWARHSLAIDDTTFVTVSVGNCNRAKNHAALLRAIALLPRSIPLLHLHIGREEPGNPERTLANSLGISHAVRFLGSQADPLPLLWAADAFVMPSLHEGLGLSAIEGVAAGLLLVCSDVEGLADIAAETRWTILTQTSPESIAIGLQNAVAMVPEMRRMRAMEDSRRVRERFSIENGVGSIVHGLYQRESNELRMRGEDWVVS